ncbi:hypothetical protein JST97_22610 [bacterium]|nr:hypothetical protein [bacterium]
MALKEKSIKRILIRLICLLAVFTLGCGSASDPETLADPTNQLPSHLNWNTYNLYVFEPSTQTWNKIVSLGSQTGTIPALGNHPTIFVHGLGSDIRDGTFTLMAEDLLQQGKASVVFGFEYDTQDGITPNSTYFTAALQLLNPGVSHPTWSFIGHSMGGLVIRASVQTNVLPIAASGNKVVTLATPHFGSPVANAVQSADLVTQTLVVGLLNQGGFTNADGNPSKVSLQSQGITDLRTDSQFLGVLNAVGNINNHPQADYYTVAGTDLGTFARANSLLGVSTDDGLVTVASANPPQLMPVGTGTVATDHTHIETDQRTILLVRSFLP